MQRLAPGRFWAFSAALFERQKDYFDERVLGETRNETYERLAEVAAEVGVGKGEVLELLKVEEGEAENKGNGVTGDVKVMVKVSLQRGEAWRAWRVQLLMRFGGGRRTDW